MTVTHVNVVPRALAERVGVVTSTTASPLEPKTVQDVLVRVLKERGLEPRTGWVAVRLVEGTAERLYSVSIRYEPARAELASVLRNHHASSTENDKAGIWVLTESEAHSLCEGGPPDLLYVRV